jgi:hypothetical protein
MSHLFKKNYNQIIKLARTADEIGDFNCALNNYIIALEILNKSNNKSKEFLRSAADLKKLIDRLEKKKDKSNSVLFYNIGKRCLKNLFAEKEKSAMIEPQLSLFNSTCEHGDRFREEQFPRAINVLDKVGNWGFFDSYTKYLLKLSGKQVIFEATIIEDDILIMCDVLVKNENGKIDIFEIKYENELNKSVLKKLAEKYTICNKRFGINLNSFNLILRSGDTGQDWYIQDLMEMLTNLSPIENELINSFKVVLKNEGFITEQHNYCDSPAECGFQRYCTKLIFEV